MVRNDVTVKIYAKSNQRVRIEVVHDLRANARTIGGRRSTADPQDLLRWFNSLTADAADHVNTLLREVQSDLREGINARPMFALPYAIARAAPDASLGEAMLALLVWNEAISLGNRDPFRSLVMALVEAGVLYRVHSRRHTFALVPDYRPAARQLRGVVGSPGSQSSRGSSAGHQLQQYRHRSR